MLPKKTYHVEKLKERVNLALASQDTTPVGRLALIELLEFVLHQTGNYKGFRYLELHPEHAGAWKAHLGLPMNTTPEWYAKYAELRLAYFGDESRREYF